MMVANLHLADQSHQLNNDKRIAKNQQLQIKPFSKTIGAIAVPSDDALASGWIYSVNQSFLYRSFIQPIGGAPSKKLPLKSISLRNSERANIKSMSDFQNCF